MTAEEFSKLMNEGIRRGPSLQEKWEAFYLLPLPPSILRDAASYFRIRERLLAEGKCYRT